MRLPVWYKKSRCGGKSCGMVDTARMACKSCKHHFDAGKVGLNDLAITYTLTLGLDMIGPSNMVQ